MSRPDPLRPKAATAAGPGTSRTDHAGGFLRDAHYALVRGAARVGLAVLLRLHVSGAEHTRRPGGFLLVANHISHFDPALLLCAARRPVDWMTTEEFFRPWWLGAFWRSLNAFPVDRTRADLGAARVALGRLRRGRVVGVFPEGGIRSGPRSVLGGARLQSGICHLAAMARAPVVPAVILGSDRLYAPASWTRPRQVRVWVRFGAALEYDEEQWHGGSGVLEARLRALEERFAALCAGLQADCGLGPADLPHSPQRRKGLS